MRERSHQTSPHPPFCRSSDRQPRTAQVMIRPSGRRRVAHGDHQGFAADLGINLLYLESLMNEPFTVSNPSARLLKRMSLLLNVSVGYLLGETFETDPVLRESLGTWNYWVDSTPGLDAGIANRIKKDWQEDYGRSRKQAAASLASLRDKNGAMRNADWDKKYQEALKKTKGGNSAEQQRFF